jgi:hypothetical protein
MAMAHYVILATFTDQGLKAAKDNGRRERKWSPPPASRPGVVRRNRGVLDVNLLRMFLRDLVGAQKIWFRRFDLACRARHLLLTLSLSALTLRNQRQATTSRLTAG